MNRREFQLNVLKAAALLAATPMRSAIAAESAAKGGAAAIPEDHMAAMNQLFIDLADGDMKQIEMMMPAKERHIGMVAYPGMFPLDFVGPHEFFAGLMHTKVHVIAADDKPVGTPNIKVIPNCTYKDCPDNLDVLFVPGGLEGTISMMGDAAALSFLRAKAKTSRYVVSVCTGSLILGAAGLLKGRKAATYWSARDILPLLGATPVVARWVEDGNVITGGGVTAGMDMALAICAKLAGEPYAKALQLYMEYEPAPPFHSGTPETAEKKVIRAMSAMYADGMERMRAAAKRV